MNDQLINIYYLINLQIKFDQKRPKLLFFVNAYPFTSSDVSMLDGSS